MKFGKSFSFPFEDEKYVYLRLSKSDYYSLVFILKSTRAFFKHLANYSDILDSVL